MKHTVRSLRDAIGVTVAGNVAYLPNKEITKQTLAKIGLNVPRQSWFKQECRRMGLSPIKPSSLMGFIVLETLNLARHTANGSCWKLQTSPFSLLNKSLEPAWMDKLPDSAKRYLRYSHAIGDGMDPLGIVPQFPYMGFGYIIPNYGMASDSMQVFKLPRLAGIKQLGFLHDPVLKEHDRSAGALMFEHTRYCHSLDVSIVANIVASNIGLDEVMANTLFTAAISHDALTPAGGDSVKLIDPVAFDEDAHYPELLSGQLWEAYREKYAIDRELLIQTVLGKGLLGRILDIADKSSYLARDAQAYFMRTKPKKDARNTAFYVLADILNSDPFICAVWESARKYKDSLVFHDIDRLTRFLKLRALMFRELYYNPYSRFLEYLVGKGVVKYLYMKGLVTREELLEQQDFWIEKKIDEVLGTYSMLYRFHDLGNFRMEEYRDIATAKRRLAEFDNDPSTIVILDNFASATSNGTKKFLVRKGRGVEIFADACPEATEEIDSIMTFPNIVRLYFFDANDLQLSKESCRKLKEILRFVT